MSFKNKIYIGIDCGKQTGFAFWDSTYTTPFFREIKTTTFWGAINRIKELNTYYHNNDISTVVVIEDPNENAPVFGITALYAMTKSSHAGKLGAVARKAQNVGAVKRETKLMIDWCRSIHHPAIQVITVRPTARTMTKIKAGPFKSMTGYDKTTSQHGRDAACLVLGR